MAGMISLALFLNYGLSVSYFVYFIFGAALIVVTFIDLQYRLIPDVITLPGIALGVIATLFLQQISFLDSIIGAALGGGFLFLVAIGYYFLTKKEGMGGGDIKLLAMIGAFLGWKSLFLTVFISSALGSIVGVILMIKKGKDRKYAVPFGPFLAIGALIYLFWGNSMMKYYLNISGYIPQ